MKATNILFSIITIIAIAYMVMVMLVLSCLSSYEAGECRSSMVGQFVAWTLSPLTK